MYQKNFRMIKLVLQNSDFMQTKLLWTCVVAQYLPVDRDPSGCDRKG